VLHYLRSPHERRLLIPEINLIVQTVRLVENCLDDGADDFAAAYFHPDVIADFVGRGIGAFCHELTIRLVITQVSPYV
jgi:hypothetical protein